MKLYSGDLSPYSAKVRMQIYAKGIEDITLERPTGFGTQDWWKTSPIGRIPALELANGDIIPESEVIAEYLEEIYPEPRLLGATPRETAAIRTVSRLADIYLLNNMFMLAGQTRASTRSEAVRVAIDRYAAILDQYCRSDPYNWFNFHDFWRAPGAQA